MRADQTLVARGLVGSRSAAQRLIDRGTVQRRAPNANANWTTVAKTGEDVAEATELRITDAAELRWVSRAGLKLDAALAHLGLDVSGLTVLDAGQSTGGFTQVLLARGAARVVGIDVGHDQLHASLRGHARITALEGVNARALTRQALGTAMPERGFDLAVADLSFISLAKVLPALVPLLAPRGALLALVKPQFELQPGAIGKGGLVRDAASYAEVERKLRDACRQLGLIVIDWFESAVAGGDGNREFFIHAATTVRGAEGALHE